MGSLFYLSDQETMLPFRMQRILRKMNLNSTQVRRIEENEISAFPSPAKV